MSPSSPAARPPGTAMAEGPADSPADEAAGGPTASATGPADDATDGSVGSTMDGTAQTPPGPGVGSAEWNLLTDDIRWSAETFRLLGCDPGQAPLSLDRLPDRLDEADRPLLRRMMTDALVHGRCAVGTVLVRRPGGGHGAVECAGEPVIGVDGTVTALRMMLRPA
ncbi:hypothetical protein ACIGZJ_28955 [Kitasatospora sp. NPDC052868]|uniref:hypothetical protein n=1 Tax=Kitasatospora sp. NPDC052868 TaxID=3364060 RepID=UPI0037C5C071